MQYYYFSKKSGCADFQIQGQQITIFIIIDVDDIK